VKPSSFAWILCGLALFLAMSVNAELPAAQSGTSNDLTSAQVAQDLTYFRDSWVPLDRSFSPAARAKMLEFIDQQISSAHAMHKAELALILGQAAAFSGNDHTLIEIYNAREVFHPLPISFWWFPEGAIVTRAHPAYRRFLGARIVSIGGVPVDEVATRMERYIPGIETHKRYISPILMTRIEALQVAGVTQDSAADFEFVLRSGERVRASLGVAPTPDPAAVSPAWRASMVPGKGPDPWPHVLDDLKDLPIYVQKPDELAWATLRNGSLLYIRSNSLDPYTDNPLEVILKGYLMMDTLVKSASMPNDVVVDLRYNEGGNFINVLALSTELAKLTEPAGHIYIITGRATNSAAIAFAALLKGNVPGRTKIVGESISDHEWFWSEGGSLTAPASGLPLRYTNGYHDWANGCTDLKKCYWPVVYHGVKAGSLQPDILVPLTFHDYVSGKDPVLDAVLAELDKSATHNKRQRLLR